MRIPLAFLAATPSPNPFESIAQPIVGLLNMVVGPALLIVGAIGTIWCILLGVKLAKAEEQQDRDKAKNSLKNAIIGFVAIFVLMAVLNIAMKPLADWAGVTLLPSPSP